MRLASSAASLGLTDYSQVDMLGSLYQFVHFGGGKMPGAQIDRWKKVSGADLDELEGVVAHDVHQHFDPLLLFRFGFRVEI